METRLASPPINETVFLDEPELFGWRGGGVVIFVMPLDNRWIVSRGWTGQGKLTDVRRWRFASPLGMVGQIRRLIADASDHATGRKAGALAAKWAIPMVEDGAALRALVLRDGDGY